MTHFLSLRLEQLCSLIVSTTCRYRAVLLSDVSVPGAHLVTFLLLAGTAGLAEAHAAPPVLDCLALLLVVHLADLVTDRIALLVLHRLALLLVHGLAGGSGGRWREL